MLYGVMQTAISCQQPQGLADLPSAAPDYCIGKLLSFIHIDYQILTEQILI